MTTPWKTNMDPENHWFVEENSLSGSRPGSSVVIITPWSNPVQSLRNPFSLTSRRLAIARQFLWGTLHLRFAELARSLAGIGSQVETSSWRTSQAMVYGC